MMQLPDFWSLMIYPAVVYVCALVGWRYAVGAWQDFKTFGPDRAVWMRFGIVLGFVIGSGAHSALWGTVRWLDWFGFAEWSSALSEFGLGTAVWFRLAVLIAALMHLYAATHDYRHLRRDVLMTAGLLVGAASVLLL